MSSTESVPARSCSEPPLQGSVDDTRLGKLKKHLRFNSECEKLDVDIEQTMREIQAIIAVNDEISSRCMVYANTEDKNNAGWVVLLERVGYNTIYTRQAQGEEILELVTRAERIERRFDTARLSGLPLGLVDTISVHYKQYPFSAFIDYDDFFQKAEMLLCDDALKLFLPKLKDHLESVQVCLGVIDQWVMQPMSDLSFINMNFQKALTLPTDIHPFDDTCVCCFCGATCGRDRGGSGYPYNKYDRGGSGCTYKKCGVEQVLVRLSNNHGVYRTTFTVSMEKEQERLLKFIHFVS